VFSPAGDWLAAAHGPDVVLWDPAAGKKLVTLKGDTTRVAELGILPLVSSLAISPDARWLATSTAANIPGASGEIPLWRLPSVAPSEKGFVGERSLLLKGFDAAVTSIAFSPDGVHLVSASLDETVKIWDVPDLIATAASLKQAGADPKAIDAALAGKARVFTVHTAR